MSFQKWSPDELKEAVKAYNQMRDLEISGKKFVKAEIIRGLIAGSLKNRSKGSIEKRFQNISSVYQHRGEAWVRDTNLYHMWVQMFSGKLLTLSSPSNLTFFFEEFFGF